MENNFWAAISSAWALYSYIHDYRYYIGTRSYIIVKDMEILKQITTKHFNNFMDRQVSQH